MAVPIPPIPNWRWRSYGSSHPMIEPPVTLREIKESEEFSDWALVRQSRLSTMTAPDDFVEWIRKRDPKLNSKYSIFLDLAALLFQKWNSRNGTAR